MHEVQRIATKTLVLRESKVILLASLTIDSGQAAWQP